MSSQPVIEVFVGAKRSPTLAEVYARVAGLPGGGDWSMHGQIRGPHCRYARTLPTSHAFVDASAGDTLLARATIPDPCFWSMELPGLYRVHLELRHGDTVSQVVEREIGLRFLETHRTSLYLSGKRWVARAVHLDAVQPTPLEQWRELETVMVVDDPSEELCRDAARDGVMLIARVDFNREDQLRSLSQWASVAFVVAKDSRADHSLAKHCLPNTILLGQDVSFAASDMRGSAVMLDLATFSVDQLSQSAKSIPTIALRRLPGPRKISLAEARLQCDALQRDLAPSGEFAGFVV